MDGEQNLSVSFSVPLSSKEDPPKMTRSVECLQLMMLHVRKSLEPNDELRLTVDTHHGLPPSPPPSLPPSPPALGHQSDEDPCHLHPAVRAVRLPALRGAAGGHLQTHRGLVCAGLSLLRGHHPDDHRIWRLCGR